jgi:hypothetical protein
VHKFIAHAIGSLELPMTDAQSEAKFRDLADGILPATQLGSASAIAQAARNAR